MPDQNSKGTTQGERIQLFCKLLWGESEYGYDLEIATDDYLEYQIWVRKDHGDSFGDPVMASGLCGSADKAFDDLERRLVIHCKHAISGKPMTREEKLDFGGKKYRAVLESVLDEEDRLRRVGAIR